ncbi:hypothetical protein SeMB42_g05184 [Synchytrium endobioticum]|uniref:Glucanase n=1 Tax=Synchytrium endobioticum TaxID=286115 RepID=A0A507D859_9FUNG|nr:hypothetical protein SeMB42_g05184 [Synchytrium endobioticum]TPX47497.1 hypothetical protein SeLEV6574_g02626 [Synchytrium endobioticum]
MYTTITVAATLFASVYGQQAGTIKPEVHPKLGFQTCVKGGTCTPVDTAVTLDANWRWAHNKGKNCYTGTSWDATFCPDGATCAKTCALDGADYEKTYGVTTNNTHVTLKYVSKDQYGTSVGSRLYVMASETKYQMFFPLNKEMTFDVDLSQLPCGLNGAVYFVAMPEDGGMSAYPDNKAGAKYGTGYCDTQCPHDIKWIAGEANVAGWNTTTAVGNYGACCAEMDLWEANSISTALTPHVCTTPEYKRCSGTECGDGDNRYGGICDKDGCDYNPTRMGNPDFYGPGKTIDTKLPITVVTQFITDDGTDTGNLKEVKRFYVQNGKVFANPNVNVPGVAPTNSITEEFCVAQKTAFGDTNSFSKLGGMKAMGDAMKKGMVMVLSLWDDSVAQMLWLDSNYHPGHDLTAPGAVRGTCNTTSGVPSESRLAYPTAQVAYGNLKFGEIGSTFNSAAAV